MTRRTGSSSGGPFFLLALFVLLAIAAALSVYLFVGPDVGEPAGGGAAEPVDEVEATHRPEDDASLPMPEMSVGRPAFCENVIEAKPPSVLRGLLYTMPFDGTLDAIRPDGRVFSGRFSRPSLATRADFTLARPGEPRYWPSSRATGLLMENGWTGYGGNVPGVMNRLPPDSAGAENAPRGFSVVGDCVLGPSEESIQGERALRIVPARSGGGCATDPCSLHKAGMWIASLYAKGDGGGAIEVEVFGARAGEQTPSTLASKRFDLTDDWVQRHVTFPVKAVKKGQMGKSSPEFDRVHLTVRVMDGARAVLVDALMLEPEARYHARREPSTWIPGGRRRLSDTLSVPADQSTFRVRAGTISMVFTPRALGGWNCLACYGNGWRGSMRLDVRAAGKSLEAGLFGAKLKGAAAFETGRPSHVALTWDQAEAHVYFEGKRVGSVELAAVEERKEQRTLAIGGSPDISSPNIKADGVIDDFSVWARPLDEGEIAHLAAKTTAVASLVPIPLRIKELTPCAVYCRDESHVPVRWLLSQIPHGAAETVVVEIDAYGRRAVFPDGRPGSTSAVVEFPLKPGHLMPGDYVMNLYVPDGTGRSWLLRRPFTIAPARVPWDSLQVLSWNHFDARNPEFGFTISFGGQADDVDRNSRLGMYSQTGLQFTRKGMHLADVRAEVEAAAEKFALRAESMPSLRAAIINTENCWGSHRVRYDQHIVRIARDRFGLDLTKWRDIKEQRWMVDLPGGRANPFRVPGMVPEDRIIPLDHPLYAFHRWYHGPDGATEVVVNEIEAEAILARRPDFFAMFDPILRRPALKTYRHVNIAQDWTYYTDPKNMIVQYEQLFCIGRELPYMVPSTMPQFLLKPGMAAPFGGHPTAEMLREACWLVCARPTRVMTFWNFRGALDQGKQNTPDAVEEALGGTPNRSDTQKIIKEKGLKLHAWTPELRDEFKRFARGVWRPFGALFPRWHNAPRRVALVRSFAAELYSNTRWPRGGWLQRGLLDSGVPYDVLFDQDFETEGGAALDYDAVLVPKGHALTRPTVEALRGYIARGGTVVVDDDFRVSLEGVTKLAALAEKDATDLDQIRKKEQELLAKYGGNTAHPQYVESMEALVEKRSVAALDPRIREVLAQRVALPVRSETPSVCLNVLAASGATYVVAVNDLRRPGRIYGRYDKIRESGVAQRAVLAAAKSLGAHVYDLTARTPLETKPGPDAQTHRIALDLGPCDGKILMFLDRPIGELQFGDAPREAPKGSTVSFQIVLAVGAPEGRSAGLVPVELALMRPDGTRSDLSRYHVMDRGELVWMVPIAANAPAGTWKVVATEFATGRRAERSFTVR